MVNSATKGDQTIHPECPECEDLGWKITADGGAGTAVQCDCKRGQRAAQHLALAGIPERYRDCRLDSFDIQSSVPSTKHRLEKALRIGRGYIDNFYTRDGKIRQSGLIFVGNPGGGKTHLAASILSEVVERYHVRGLFVDFTSLLHQLQSTFDSDSVESKRAVLDPVIKTDLVVLDELGAQKSTEWVMNTLYLIINSRYTAGRPTLFTTNYRLGDLTKPTAQALYPDLQPHSDEYAALVQSGKVPKNPVKDDLTLGKGATLLATRISPQLVSRLHEMTQPVYLDVPDFRLRKKPRHELARQR
jgi:DNA replication protein DnaC